MALLSFERKYRVFRCKIQHLARNADEGGGLPYFVQLITDSKHDRFESFDPRGPARAGTRPIDAPDRNGADPCVRQC